MNDHIPERDGRPPMGRLDASWRGDYIAKATADELVDGQNGVTPDDGQRCAVNGQAINIGSREQWAVGDPLPRG